MKFNSVPSNIVEALVMMLSALKWFVWRQENGMVMSRLTVAVFGSIIRVAEAYLADTGVLYAANFDAASYDDEVKGWFNNSAAGPGERAIGREEYGQ